MTDDLRKRVDEHKKTFSELGGIRWYQLHAKDAMNLLEEVMTALEDSESALEVIHYQQQMNEGE